MLPAEPSPDPQAHTKPLDRSTRAEMLADRRLMAALARVVRRRVPAAEVDDVVQSTLAEALAAATAPSNAAEFEKWVYGIAHHKCADFFRRTRREAPSSEVVEQAAAADSSRQSAQEWLKWAHRELPPGEQADRTLEWMLREANGEKLETIAADERLPAPRVRQRVVRMRQHFRGRWAAQLAAILAAIALAVTAAFLLRGQGQPVARPIEPEQVRPAREAAELRRVALEQCQRGEWRPCVEGLDAAKMLDREGDLSPDVQRAREAAGRGLAPAPVVPKAAPTPSSSSTAPAPSAPARGNLAPRQGKLGEKEQLPLQQEQSANGEKTFEAPERNIAPQAPQAPSKPFPKKAAKPSGDYGSDGFESGK